MNYYVLQLQRIYDSEINFCISTFWDGGFDVKIGNPMGGYLAETNTKKMETAVEWLIDKVLELYPNSFYAYYRISLINKIREGHVDTNKFTPYFLNQMLSETEQKNPCIYGDLKEDFVKQRKANT